MLFVNIVILTILAFWILKCFRPSVEVAGLGGEKTTVSGVTWLIAFTLATGPLFLFQVALVKYILWCAVIFLLWMQSKCVWRFNMIVIAYLLFLLWVLFGIVITPVMNYGLMIGVKYVLLLLFFMLGYAVTPNADSLKYVLNQTNKAILFYAVFCGGISWHLYRFTREFASLAVLTYAGLADFFTAVSPVGIVLFMLTRRKVFLIPIALALSSDILEAVRTGIGGIFIVAGTFLVAHYRWRSLLFLPLVALFAYIVVFHVPFVREKMFKDEALEQMETEGVGIYLLDSRNIRDHGRKYMQDYIMDNYYQNSPWMGSGSGVANQAIAEQNLLGYSAGLLHNDYLQIICDHGLFGLWLWILFSLTVIVQCARTFWSPHASKELKLIAIGACGSFCGMLFAMRYDNVISHSMSSIAVSCILLGIFMRFRDHENGTAPGETS